MFQINYLLALCASVKDEMKKIIQEFFMGERKIERTGLSKIN